MELSAGGYIDQAAVAGGGGGVGKNVGITLANQRNPRGGSAGDVEDENKRDILTDHNKLAGIADQPRIKRSECALSEVVSISCRQAEVRLRRIAGELSRADLSLRELCGENLEVGWFKNEYVLPDQIRTLRRRRNHRRSEN